VLQETFFKAYLAINSFEGKSKIYSWLARIAINCALMILRTRRVRSEVLFDSQPDDRGEVIAFEVRDSAPNPESFAFCISVNTGLWAQSVVSVRICERQFGCKSCVDGRLGEISRALNITEAAVKSRLYRARQQLLLTEGIAILHRHHPSSSTLRGKIDDSQGASDHQSVRDNFDEFGQLGRKRPHVRRCQDRCRILRWTGIVNTSLVSSNCKSRLAAPATESVRTRGNAAFSGAAGRFGTHDDSTLCMT
jgi:hypothetical protein